MGKYEFSVIHMNFSVYSKNSRVTLKMYGNVRIVNYTHDFSVYIPKECFYSDDTFYMAKQRL